MGNLTLQPTSLGAEAEVLSHQVISQNPNLYCGWPTLTRRANGELILVFSGGREEHVCPFGRVDMMRSRDNGETWSWPRTIHDSAIDDRDAGVLETQQGTLLVTTFSSLAYESILEKAKREQSEGKSSWSSEKLDRWNTAHTRLSDSQRQAELGQWMLRSTDGGLSWSQRYRCPVNSPHGPIQLDDGSLLYAGIQLWDDPRGVGVCISEDDGLTWKWKSDLPTRAGDDSRNYHELHAVQCKSGKIILHIRNHNSSQSRETLQSESNDGGKTWSEPHAIGVWGLPSFLLRLKSGRILMSYGYRREPFGNQARYSDDEGTTWSAPLTLSGDGIGGDLGYPSTVELDDGSLLSIWYERLQNSPRAVLRQARWRIHS
ncbi:MAG: sialidase family protein [Planctomycetota bacterium]|nr:sialidase family protein [Planctomycetota bacterium]